MQLAVHGECSVNSARSPLQVKEKIHTTSADQCLSRSVEKEKQSHACHVTIIQVSCEHHRTYHVILALLCPVPKHCRKRKTSSSTCTWTPAPSHTHLRSCCSRAGLTLRELSSHGTWWGEGSLRQPARGSHQCHEGQTGHRCHRIIAEEEAAPGHPLPQS